MKILFSMFSVALLAGSVIPTAQAQGAVSMDFFHDTLAPYGSYRFVEDRNFGARRLKSVFIAKRDNIWIIHNTTNVTNIIYQNQAVHNGGMAYELLSRASTVPSNRYKLSRRLQFDGDPRNQSAEALRSRVAGGSLSMQPPSFSGKPATSPGRVLSGMENVQTNHGWNNAGSFAEITLMRAKLKSNVAAPRELQARADVSKKAAHAGSNPYNIR